VIGEKMLENLLKNKKILLGITGSIAAYKSAELVRLLKNLGAEVRVVMSSGASSFITAMTLQVLSGHSVYQTLLNTENEAAMSHIDLARWADLIVIAPATAHFLAKLAIGFADDLLSTLCLASSTSILIAPAMNTYMWENSATQANVSLLLQRGIHFISPAMGSQACGEVGIGRMEEPSNIVTQISDFINNSLRLKDKTIIITAGATQEAIDPVRYISNHSSGKMGYALAEAAERAGAQVILISAPTALDCPYNVKRVDVISTQQMLKAVMQHISTCDVFIATAAVADYRLQTIHEHKIKKTSESLSLELIRNPDILNTVSQLKSPPITVGFAAETDNLIEYAKQKLHAKKLDMIVANWVGQNRGFQSDYNELTVITPDNIQLLPYATKKELAKTLINLISECIEK
jgi:phosphopantothenoylcysteine decarboxylase/phosphopantothenate--cysteine ligase